MVRSSQLTNTNTEQGKAAVELYFQLSDQQSRLYTGHISSSSNALL
jgi:hypothetical protein